MFKLLIGIVVPLIFLFIILNQYSIIQSQHYEIYKYFKYETKKKILVQSMLFILLISAFYLNVYLCFFVLIISFILNLFLIKKSKLKWTKRIKRYISVYYCLTYLLYILLPFNEIVSLIIVNDTIIINMILSHCFSLCIESIIMNCYIRDAKKNIKGIKIIGVTGSYGKTSCKNIIYDMLENLCNVSKTPKSYNTKVGIVKSIRENISEFDDVFICEYGVDKKGGMDKLLKIVKPNISLITEVGPQHLLTFKNIENIKNEKIKLAKTLKEEETAIINNDNVYLKEEINNLKCKVITYGIENDSDIMAKNIKITNEGSVFDLYIDNKKIKNININLLGKHNVLNVLGSIGVLKSLNVNLYNIEALVRKIKPVEHRLQLKNINGLKIVDDSFNSNEKGFKNAVDILKMMQGEKIVVTPGIIEQGNNSNNINYDLAKYMADKVDKVILVEKNASIMKQGLLDSGFEEKNIIIKKDFFEAWELLSRSTEKENKIILIENDLPCIYLK